MRRETACWTSVVWVLASLLCSTGTARAEPKNVIVFIGDGMGFEQIKAAGMYANGAPGTLLFESLPRQGQLTTYSADNAVTDSAAAGTALATGVKVNNGVISVALPGDGSELHTLLEHFKARGKSTGLVTTSYMTDATPAAFGAHEASRSSTGAIAGDYLSQTRPEVLLGGGGNGLTPASAQGAGYTVLQDAGDLLALSTETATLVSGQFGTGQMPYEYDGVGALPHLTEMTDVALRILDNDPDGLFLMVEGGNIDHACHSSDLARTIPEVLEFSDAVQLGIAWAAGRDDTLILVTADHETGGLGVISNNGVGQLPTVTWTGGGGHTAANVPLFAWGVNAEKISSVMDNTDMFAVAVEPSVHLIGPADGAVLDSTSVSFSVAATDFAGLSQAALYVGGVPQTVTLSGPTATDDAQIRSDNAALGAATPIVVDASDESSRHCHAVLKFPGLIGAGPGQVPPGSAISSATLKVNCMNSGNIMTMDRLVQDWTEGTVTWSSPWTNPGADGSVSRAYEPVTASAGTTGWLSFNVTSFVQAWANGQDNYGIVFLDGGTDGVDFDSSESANPPVLTVEYGGLPLELKETVPLSGTSATVTFSPQTLADQGEYSWSCLVTNAVGEATWAPASFRLSVDSATGLPDAPQLVGPVYGATVGSLSPVLAVTVSDPNGGDVQVEFFGRGDEEVAEFAVVPLPDTQYYTLSDAANTTYFRGQTQWIASNRTALNISFVTHEGDITDDPDTYDYWVRARSSMDLIHGLVPYGIGPGNHDVVGTYGDTTYFNDATVGFPYTRYASQPWYGGHYPETSNENSFQLFSAGGDDYLVLHLAYNAGGPAADVLTWANGVLAANGGRKAIITTHSFLNTDGSRTAEGTAIWNSLVVTNDNVFLVLCGHNPGEKARTDVVGGREVHQLLADYQGRTNGGDGWLRLLRFVPAADMVYVETYSPTRDEYEFDGTSSFALKCPMTGFRLLGTQSVTSGSTASLVWADLALRTEHEWFVKVTDASGNTQVGPVWRFRTGTGDSIPPVISNVEAVDVTDHSATVTWTTDEPADSLVEYGLDANYGATGSDPTLVTSHSILITGLAPVTTYHYRVSSKDSSENSASSTDYTFTTLPLNHPPVAQSQSVTMAEDSTGTAITLLATDQDTGTTLTYRVVTPPSHGSLSGSPPDVTYTPTPDYSGPDSFTFVANDGVEDSNVATVSITVTPVQDPPTATDDTAATDEDVAVAIAVLTNDSDPDGDTLLITEHTQGTYGGVTLSGDTLTYTPGANWSGTDTFQYTISDGYGGADTATVTVTVNAVNDPPLAYGQSLTTAEDTPLPITLTGSDVESPSLTYDVVTPPAHGSLSGTPPSVTYTPSSNYFGPDSFTFVANDGLADSNVATVSIEVTGVNDAPAAPQNVSAVAGISMVSLDWADNSEPEGDLSGYRVYRSTTSGSYDFGTPPPSVAVSEYTDTGLANGTTYYYVVKAVDSSGLESAPSAEVSAKPSAAAYDAYATANPTITYGTLGGAGFTGTQVQGDGLVQTITEAANGTQGRSSLQAEYALHTAADPAEVTGLVLNLTATWTNLDAADPLKVSVWTGSAWQDITSDIADGSFTPGSSPGSYINAAGNIRVLFQDTAKIRNEGKDTLSIDLLYAHVVAGPPDTTAPTAPTGLSATGNDALLLVNLSWTAHTEPDIAGYKVYRSVTSGSGYELVTPTAITETAYTDPVGAPGTYFYVVTALDQAGNESGYSSEASATLIDQPPAAPTGLAATAGSGQVTLDWSDNQESDLAGYNVYRSTMQGSGYAKINLALVTAISYVDSGLTNGTTYYYVVTAVDGAQNESAYSAEVSATPAAQANSVHVEAITMAIQKVSKNYRARATVLVHDQGEALTVGAVVTGDWYLKGALIQTGATGTTNETGNAVVSSPTKPATTGDVFRFVVTGVTLSGYTYDPSKNVASEGSIPVP